MHKAKEIEKVSLRNKIARAIWNVVYLFLYRPFRTKLFNIWRLFLLRLFGADVQWDSGVYASTKIWAPWNLKMGHNAWLGPNVICYNQAMITLEDNVTVSQYTYLCTAGHKTDIINNYNKGLVIAPITLHRGVWVGTRAYVSMGVEIGENAIVGATASVYKDVEKETIVGGNPAKFIKKRVIKDLN
ncbi:MAG: putative colanic acid biosynthesis acetyltransferase [Prevotella sp.]